MITYCACVECWHVVAVLFGIIADGVFPVRCMIESRSFVCDREDITEGIVKQVKDELVGPWYKHKNYPSHPIGTTTPHIPQALPLHTHPLQWPCQLIPLFLLLLLLSLLLLESLNLCLQFCNFIFTSFNGC